MKIKKIILFIIFYITGFTNEEIEITVPTQSTSFNIYLSDIYDANNYFPDNYIEQMQNVFKFDFINSGIINLLDQIKIPPKELLDKNWFLNKKLQTDNAFLNIKLYIINKKLNIEIFSNKTTNLKKISFALSGNLNIDRCKVHKIIDEILQTYLNFSSILTKKLIYCIKTPIKDSSKRFISEIWLSDYDGANEKQLTFGNDFCLSPTTAPNLKNDFLYVDYKTSQSKIYLFSKSENPFIKLSGNQLLPSLSNNLDKLCFISDVMGRPDLFLQYLSPKDLTPLGKPIQLFSQAYATQASSSFSSDGEKIAFVSDKNGSANIYIIKIPKEKEGIKKLPQTLQVTTKNKTNVCPSWSIDGTKLAYSAKTEGIYQIWIYDFIKKKESQLTYDNKNKENPKWAHDNLHLIYNTEDNKTAEIYLIDINNKKPVKIKNNKLNIKNRFANWLY